MPSIQPIAAALQAGNPGEAERLCRELLQAQPKHADVLVLLALSLHQQRKMAEAVAVYAELTQLFPESPVHWGNYGTALRDEGRLDEAAEAYALALRYAPSDPHALVNMGLLQLQKRDFGAACDTLLRALASAPDSPDVRIHAARACVECRDYRADDLLKPWRQWLPLAEDLQLELASLQLALGDANAALVILEDLAKRPPVSLLTMVRLANVYERVNRTEDAESLLRRIEASGFVIDDAASCEIDHQRAKLAARKGDQEGAKSMLEKCGPRHEADYDHYFELAGLYDKLGQTAAAMDALRVAHAKQIAELKIAVPFRFEPGAPILPAAVHRVSASDYQKWPELRAPDAEQSPVFIVGFPRSGTTLLEQMLDAHPRLQSMDERPFFNILSDQLEDYGARVPQDLHRLDQRDCDELRKGYLTLACSKVPRRWGARLVDKNPLNMLWLPLIYRLFPRAKFILALRHPCDVLLSNYMLNFRSAVLVQACENLERLATAYVTAMEYWLHHVEVFKPDLLISRYEELVADTELRTRKIAEFLGLDDAAPLLQFDRRAREKGFIATPSYTQVIQPVNKKGLNRWQRYRREFEPVLPVLEPMLRHWGYSTQPEE